MHEYDALLHGGNKESIYLSTLLIEHEIYLFTLKTLFGFFIRCTHGNVHLMSVSVPGGRGYSDIFIHTYAWAIFWGLKILNFNIFFCFQKHEYFWGYEE